MVSPHYKSDIEHAYLMIAPLYSVWVVNDELSGVFE